jgi:CheY-like chemotaxis protein
MDSTSVAIILLVEDDDELRKTLADFIRKMGFRVLTASQGEEALKCFDSEKVDLILSDVQMPNMSGVELAQQIFLKNRMPPPRILLMTGHSDVSEQSAKAVGASGLIYKPCSLKTLQKAIRDLIP